MTIYYEGKHKVLFKVDGTTYDSWTSWHLIPKSRPVISPPQERSNLVTIPGRHGKLDLSWAFTGEPIYENRTGSLDFYVDVSFWGRWELAYYTILSALQGRRPQIILGDDPTFYYEGLCWVDKWTSDERISSISLKYELNPFRRKVYITENEWIWDDFDFENGSIGITDNKDYI